MKQLTEYKKNGYSFSLLMRSGKIAIFVGKKDGVANDNYEVIKIQSHGGRELHGKYFEPAEYPPSNEQWGDSGWTCQTFDEACERFAKAVSEQAKKDFLSHGEEGKTNT